MTTTRPLRNSILLTGIIILLTILTAGCGAQKPGNEPSPRTIPLLQATSNSTEEMTRNPVLQSGPDPQTGQRSQTTGPQSSTTHTTPDLKTDTKATLQDDDRTCTPDTIMMNGSGTASGKHDIIEMALTISKTSHDISNIITSVNIVAKRLTRKAQDMGIQDDDLTVTNFKLYEHTTYDYDTRKQEPDGMMASIDVQLKIRDIENGPTISGQIIEIALEEQDVLVNIDRLEFDLDDHLELNSLALEKAVENLHTRAQIIADASGREIDHATKIQAGTIISPIGRGAVIEFVGSTTDSYYVPLKAGSRTIKANVSGIFILKPNPNGDPESCIAQ